ncbi:ABC transporter permease [Lachnospiraceae bacterium oral taxon 500]|nr:ABC transporter permease [Lachnospiraceae bacterium oral taxon 500]
MKRRSVRTNLTGYLFISPWLISLLVFTLLPTLWSLYLSFTNYSLLSQPKFIGLENYINMFQNPTFWKSLKVTATYALLSVPLHIITALLAALALYRKKPGIGIYRTIFYVPSFIGGSVGVAVMWRMIFSDSGFINSFLVSMGLEKMKFFNSLSNALYTLVAIQTWVLGTAMLIFIAGLQQVPQELYESATIDGAGRVRKFFSITLPLISPMVLYNLILGIINAMQVFTSGFVITKGGPAKSTYFYVLYLYEEAFKYHNMGYASALAWILFLLIFVLTLIVLRVSKQMVYYETDQKRGA